MSNFVILAIEENGELKEALINIDKILEISLKDGKTTLYTDCNKEYFCVEPIHQVYAKLRSVQSTQAFSDDWMNTKKGEK